MSGTTEYRGHISSFGYGGEGEVFPGRNARLTTAD